MDYNGKACQNWRKKNAPDVVYSNADRIRSMSDEELAEFLSNFQDIGGGLGPELCLEYIRQPAEDGRP